MQYSLSCNNSSSSFKVNHDKLSQEFCIALASYFISLSVTGLICNGILIHTISTNKKLHKSSNYLVVNLAICDVITCFNLAFDSQYLLSFENYTSGAFLCAFTKAINLALLPMSIISLLLLTIEKLLCFLYPFHHWDILTGKRTFVLLSVTWLYSIATGCFPLLNDVSALVTVERACDLQLTLAYKLYQLIVNFVLPLVGILVMNVVIFRIAMKSVAMTRRLTNGTLSKEVELTKKWRRTQTIFTVVANESLCWFSYMIAVAISIACGGCLPQQVPWIMNAVNYTSVTTNPVIYGLLNRSVREFIWNLCCERKSKNLVVRYDKGTIKLDRLQVETKHGEVAQGREKSATIESETDSLSRHLERTLSDPMTSAAESPDLQFLNSEE